MTRRASLLLSEEDAPSPPAPGRLVSGIDVSSNNGRDITPLLERWRPAHVVVKLALPVERPGLQDVSLAHIGQARNFGATVGGYAWCYESVAPAYTVQQSLLLANHASLVLPILWLDMETYTDGSHPDAHWLDLALAECDRVGQRAGIYSAKWFWDILGEPTRFADRPLWDAAFDGVPDLSFRPFGGWTRCLAKQWTITEDNLDQDVFDSSVAA